MEQIFLTEKIENSQAQMRKGILEYCILLVISQGKAYANDILQQLKEADLIVVEGTIYPLLARLKNAGALQYSWEESKAGPPRKYYQLMPAGKKLLKSFDENWSDLVKTVNSLKNN